MNVLIIPKDFRNDQYLLKPLFDRLLAVMGKPHAKVRVCNPPLLGGVIDALRDERIEEILEQYQGMIQIFVLCVDRDGQKGRRQRLNQIESKFGKRLVFLAENAWEEIETWTLAGLELPKEWRWADIRAEVHVKETYFDRLAHLASVADGPGGGRKRLGEQASGRIDAIRQKCREDFDALARRLEERIRDE